MVIGSGTMQRIGGDKCNWKHIKEPWWSLRFKLSWYLMPDGHLVYQQCYTKAYDRNAAHEESIKVLKKSLDQFTKLLIPYCLHLST